MTPDDLVTALRALTEAFKFQPLYDKAAWERHLRPVALDEFDQALHIAVQQGGSKLANQPGQRPGVSEFMAIVNLVRRKQLMDTAEPEPWPEPNPEAVKRHIDQIKRANGLTSARS